jgi:S-(hydroxymethyl)glutathione dehydrogenase/alcohol dehydrogenase
MRAFVIEAINRYSIRDDVETLPLGPLEVKVKMKAAGVCRTDLSALNGKWPTGMPCVDGHEGAGIIIEVGAHVQDRHVGQHVLLGHPQCGQCYCCSHGAPWFCERKDLGGARPKFRLADGTPVMSMVGKGTWAEEVVVTANAAIPIPDEVPFEIASLMACAVMTGTGQVINVARPEAGSSAIFFGGGGIGACAVMGAKLAGCGLIVVVEPAEAKHDALRRFGATHVITPQQVPDAVGDLTGGRGFDYSFENVGRPETLRASWDAARLDGTVVVTGLGGTQGKVEFNLNELSIHGKHLIGNVAGGLVAARDFARYCELYLLGKLDLDALITSRGTIDDLPAYLQALDSDPTVLRQVIEFE